MLYDNFGLEFALKQPREGSFAEEQDNKVVLEGTTLVSDISVIILFDIDATHSFIVKDLVIDLG